MKDKVIDTVFVIGGILMGIWLLHSIILLVSKVIEQL